MIFKDEGYGLVHCAVPHQAAVRLKAGEQRLSSGSLTSLFEAEDMESCSDYYTHSTRQVFAEFMNKPLALPTDDKNN